jgi:exodeoxyribonuclease V alpha subunit
LSGDEPAKPRRRKPGKAADPSRLAPTDADRPLVFVGTVERVRFSNPESGWAVVSVLPASPLPPPCGDGHRPTPVAVAGHFPDPQRGLAYELAGKPHNDPRFGWQVQLSGDPPEMVRPSDGAGLVRMLSCEDLRHIGPVRAERIVERWGVEETIRILEHEPERLAEIRGITEQRARETGETWRDLQASRIPREVLQALYAYGLTRYQVQRLTARYRADALEVVKQNPYRITEVDGFGFLTADAIARRVGLADDDPRRVRAALLHVLAVLLDAGNTIAPRSTVAQLVTMPRVGMLSGLGLDLPPPMVDAMIGVMLREGGLVTVESACAEDAIALSKVAETERELAAMLLAFAAEKGDR